MQTHLGSTNGFPGAGHGDRDDWTRRDGDVEGVGQAGGGGVDGGGAVRLGLEDAQGGQGSGGGGGGQAGVVDEGAGAVDQVVSEHLRAKDYAALGGQGLGQGHGDDDVVESAKTEGVNRAVAVAGYAEAMGLVDQQYGVVGLGGGGEGGERSLVA